MKIKMFLVLSLALLLIGCASDSRKVVDLNLHYVTADSAPIEATDLNAQSELAETANSVGSSLQQLSAIQMATHPSVKMPHLLDAHAIGMDQSISVDWNGPVQPLLKVIIKTAHYNNLAVLGNVPAIPVLVNVHVQNQTLYSVLRNVTYLVDKKATITIYPKKKLIELRYKDV